jgi:WhiB family redox-sensing transcriptional regulator
MDRDEMRWRDQAACVGADVNVMFPGDGNSKTADYTPAKEVCQPCPVKAECLDYALSGEHGLYGCWGGTSPRERRIVRRQRNLGTIVVLNSTYLAIDI